MPRRIKSSKRGGKKREKGEGRNKKQGGAIRDRADVLSPVCRFVS